MIALAAALLSIAHAHRAILTYERVYWRHQHATITVGHCRRRSPRQVTCVAVIRRPGEIEHVTDWATLLAHGVIRVHPGQFAIVEVLR